SRDGVFWDFNESRDSVIVTWNDVGYFASHTNRLNTFQLELRDRGAGNVEIIFRYDDVNWTTGDASRGSGGLGGIVAHAGFSLGDVFFELPASGNQGAILALEDTPGNLGVTGVWQFLIENGAPSGFGTPERDIFNGTGGRDVWFGLAGNDILRGRSGNDGLYGDAGQDTIRGGSGDDRLYGGAGSDQLFGEAGADRLNGGAGNDILNGGYGADWAEFLTSSPVTVNLRLTGPQNTGDGRDRLISIENVESGSGHDVLRGTDGSNRLNGNNGNDRLYGFGGRDQLQGGAGNDRLDGGNGDDALSGGSGADILIGGSGRDTLSGGAGNDRLTGGAGADIFVFTLGAGTDRVRDFANGEDRFEIRSGADSMADIRVIDRGADAEIRFGNVRILVEDTDHRLITGSDFLFT
ncbi:nidogen-like domain-containing protein, partial [Rhodobacter sp. NSM]|uniref:nidogen-like domain-containing protein n=1 Tax=Rhodobacter sp. NSM TaxID=3457501 RepID=UPI003FD614F9